MASVVALGQASSFEHVGFPTVNDPVTIFTFPVGVSATVESVWIFADYTGSQPGGDIFVLRGLSQGNLVQWVAQSPAFSSSDLQANVELSFALGASGTDQVPQAGPPPTQTLVFNGIASMGLPDVSLGLNGVLTLQVIQGTVGDSGPLTITGPTITYDDGGGAGVGAALDLTPYLLPTATG